MLAPVNAVSQAQQALAQVLEVIAVVYITITTGNRDKIMQNAKYDVDQVCGALKFEIL